jgi:hypothetical protein
VITDDKETADYFESLISLTDSYKAAANWLLGPVKSFSTKITFYSLFRWNLPAWLLSSHWWKTGMYIFNRTSRIFRNG